MTILRLLLSLGAFALMFFADVPSCSAARMLFQDGPPRPSISPERFVQGRSDRAAFQVFGNSMGFVPAAACFFNTVTNTCTQPLVIWPSLLNPGVTDIAIPITGQDGNVLPQGTHTIRVTGQDGRTFLVTIEIVRAQLIQWVHGLGEDYAEYWDLYGREFTNDRLADFNFQHYPSANYDPERGRRGRIEEYQNALLRISSPLASSFTSFNAPGIKTVSEAMVSVWKNQLSNVPAPDFFYTDVPFSSTLPFSSPLRKGAFRYNVSQDNKPPIMIGHSMGGIVARSVAKVIATNASLNPSTGQLGGIITVGTPNQGAQIVQSVNDGTADYAVAAAAQHIIAGPSFTLLNLSGLLTAQAAIYFQFGSGLTLAAGVVNAAGALGLGISGAAGSVVSLMPTQMLVGGVKSIMGKEAIISLPSAGVQDMLPSSPLLQSIQSSPVPIISMYGKVSTQNDNPHWRIASTFVQNPPNTTDDGELLLGSLMNFYGYNNLRPQYEKDFTPSGKSYKTAENYDNFVADMTNWTLLPIYWGGTAWSTAVSVVRFIAGDLLGGLWNAFGAVQWLRGAAYLSWTAKHDWNRLIGAQKTVQRPTLVVRSQPNFPWIFIGNELRDVVEDTDGDGLFGEEAQQYTGTNSAGRFRADGVSHNMSSNHPKAKEQFDRAFDNRNSPFHAPKRRD